MKVRSILLTLAALGAATFAVAQSVDAALQTKIDARAKQIVAWAADPAIVSAVKAQNASGVSGDLASMTQDKWKSLTVLDPLVRGLARNAAGQFLKGKKDDTVTEAFLSDAEGRKIAFLAKTTNWSHKGKPKHDVPMSGKNWQGPVEVDESTGQQQLQVAVPVLDGGKAIGSLVVGLSVTKLNQ
jgi:hypothetical protein